jgi:hypothetical protein
MNAAVARTEKLQQELETKDFELQDIQAQEEAEVLEDFVGNLANKEDSRLQEAARSERAGILPRLNTRFQSGKAMRQTTIGDIGGVSGTSVGQKSINPSSVYTPSMAGLQPVDMTKPAPTFNSFPNPQGSPIPVEYRNEQALKQLDALGKMYDNAAPALNSMLPVQPQNPTSYQQIPIVNDYLPLLRAQAFFKHGGMMTDGAFSHQSNPIDIVQEGQKVGEMTGGEYIINPTQANRIAKESSYARKLFKRFEKKAKNNK